MGSKTVITHSLITFSLLFSVTGMKENERTLEVIYSRFATIKSVAADFVEKKKSRAFSTPQIQKGRFFSSRDGKLKWEILEPIRSTFTVSGNTAMVLYPDLRYEKIYDLATDTSLSEVVKNIFAIVSASAVDVIKKNYRYHLEGNWGKGWKVTLVPRRKAVRKVIEKIVLTITDKEFIKTIEISEEGGDITLIRFANVKLNPGSK